MCQKWKVVLLVSTMHNDDKIDEIKQHLRKPEIITTYNLTKGSVDRVDQLRATYEVSRNSRRWHLTVFYAHLNVAGINAQVIFASNVETQIKRRQFLRRLAMDSMKEHRGEHAARSHVSRELRTKLKQRITSPSREPEEKRPKLQGRCAICPLSNDRKIKYMCQKCEKFLCLQHVIPLCEECVCA
jgi:hypothetical protein